MIPPTKTRALLKALVTIALPLIVIYITVSAYIASTLWRPVRHALHTTPAQYGLKYEDVQFASADDNIPLKGWFITASGANTILALHGSGSIRDNFINMEVSKALAQHGYNVFMFDFRGHGESGGDLSSLGEWKTRDVAGALAYLKTRGVSQVGALGYSMGASTELLAAPDHPEMRAIVADSAFADLYTIMDRQRSKLGCLPSFFNPGIIFMSKLLYGLDPQDIQPKLAIARLGNRPVLLIHSASDDLIPVSQAYELQKAGANNPNLELWVAQGFGHVSAFADNREEYLARVIAFFDKNLANKK